MSITGKVVVISNDTKNKKGKGIYHVTGSDATACDGFAHDLGVAEQHVTQGEVLSASFTHSNTVSGTTAIDTGRFYESIFRMEVEIPCAMPGVFVKIGIPSPTDLICDPGPENVTLANTSAGADGFVAFYDAMVAACVSTSQGTLIPDNHGVLATGVVRKNNRKGGS